MTHAASSPLGILVAYGDIAAGTTLARSGLALIEALRERGFGTVSARSAADAVTAVRADPLIGCVIVDADLDAAGGAEKVLRAFRGSNDRAPAFLFGKPSEVPAIPLSTLKLTSEFIWLTEDTSTFMAGRVAAPGIATDGSFEKRGIPAAIIAAYLVRYGFEYEKTQDFTVLFLFSIGMTKAKWGTLLTTLIRFKEDYDANTPLSVVLPGLVPSAPERYGAMGLRELSDAMFDHYRRSNQMQNLQQAFSSLPEPKLSPANAYRCLVRNQVERVNLDALANRVVATSVVPYPPGIPMMMPGENAGAADGPYIGYLKALRDWDRRFPGFAHETHGVSVSDGEHYLYCVKQ